MMKNHPDDFFLVQMHTSGTYAYTWGAVTRANFYSVAYTPTTWFDGCVEADYYPSEAQLYAEYNARYNARKAVPTDVTIDLVAREASRLSGPTATIG